MIIFPYIINKEIKALRVYVTYPGQEGLASVLA